MGIKERDAINRKNEAFCQAYYSFIDQMLECKYLEQMQYGIESLIAMNEQVGSDGILQPIKGFATLQWDLRYFLYGLLHWQDILTVLSREGEAKQVDIIKELMLEKDASGFFFYTLANIGVLSKKKSGRYNVLGYRGDLLSPSSLQSGWPGLFGEFQRHNF